MKQETQKQMKKPEIAHPSDAATGIHFAPVLVLFAVLTSMNIFTARTALAHDAVTRVIKSEASYTLGKGDSKPLARKMALFRAKVKAAGRAADQFEHQKLIQFVDRDKNELVNLVADRLGAKQLKDQCRTDGRSITCTLRIRTTVGLSDFIEAQLTSLRLGHEEEADNYRREMEPPIPSPVEPGRALAKVYRLIDKNELRMAIIYLNRLAEVYPNWREIYELKAMALKLENQPVKMVAALRKACRLGSQEACAELKP